MLVKNLFKIYTLIILFIFFAVLYIFHSISNMKTDLNSNINTIFISIAKEFTANIEHEIQQETNGSEVFKKFKNSPELRTHIEHSLSMFISTSFQYVYVLYRDSKGRYRYLLDGSIQDKGEFNQRLEVNTSKWNEVYTTKKPLVINQQNLKSLWITYLNPIVIDNEVVAVIAMDFSTTLPKVIAQAVGPINTTFIYIFIALIILLCIILFQLYIGYRIKRESYIDPLTQVYNRHYLRNFLKNNNINQYQILMLDIDFFKKINDNYGHKAGDFILQKIATSIATKIRIEDILIRYGGEEFIVFVKNNQEDIGKQIANRIKEYVAKQTFSYDQHPIRATVSIGVNLRPTRSKTINDAIKYADEMLYVAKKSGRNRVVTTQNSKTTHLNELDINGVKYAIDEQRVICHFQPIYNIEHKNIQKYEALVRIISSQGELYYPASFLDNIYGTNIYNELTNKILHIVFQTIKQYTIPVSINLNFSDILDDKIFTTLLKNIQNNSTLSRYLIVELLENEQMLNIEIIQEKIAKLKSYGVKIALDDFGSGYANFNLLELIPFDIIKIDGTLIKNIDSSEISLHVVEAVVTLAHKLGIEIVAEFVHSKEILEKLTHLEVTNAQGFYIAKPQATLIEPNIELL